MRCEHIGFIIGPVIEGHYKLRSLQAHIFKIRLKWMWSEHIGFIIGPVIEGPYKHIFIIVSVIEVHYQPISHV